MKKILFSMASGSAKSPTLWMWWNNSVVQQCRQSLQNTTTKSETLRNKNLLFSITFLLTITVNAQHQSIPPPVTRYIVPEKINLVVKKTKLKAIEKAEFFVTNNAVLKIYGQHNNFFIETGSTVIVNDSITYQGPMVVFNDGEKSEIPVNFIKPDGSKFELSKDRIDDLKRTRFVTIIHFAGEILGNVRYIHPH